MFVFYFSTEPKNSDSPYWEQAIAFHNPKPPYIGEVCMDILSQCLYVQHDLACRHMDECIILWYSMAYPFKII